MQNNLLNKIIWRYKQPLTAKPYTPELTTSDLFIWRVSSNWKTYFELLDVVSLFMNIETSRTITLIIFDANGNLLRKRDIQLIANKRCIVDLSDYVIDADGQYGTFSIFHSETPAKIQELGSYLAERGYVSYLHNNSPLRSYVHGNFDAVSINANGEIQYLGGKSFLKREYRIQYQFENNNQYEIVFVNPTERIQCLNLKIIDSLTLSADKNQIKRILRPGQVVSVKVENIEFEKFRIITSAKMVMPRPIIFKFKNDSLDVFHG